MSFVASQHTNLVCEGPAGSVKPSLDTPYHGGWCSGRNMREKVTCETGEEVEGPVILFKIIWGSLRTLIPFENDLRAYH